MPGVIRDGVERLYVTCEAAEEGESVRDVLNPYVFRPRIERVELLSRESLYPLTTRRPAHVRLMRNYVQVFRAGDVAHARLTVCFPPFHSTFHTLPGSSYPGIPPPFAVGVSCVGISTFSPRICLSG